MLAALKEAEGYLLLYRFSLDLVVFDHCFLLLQSFEEGH